MFISHVCVSNIQSESPKNFDDLSNMQEGGLPPPHPSLPPVPRQNAPPTSYYLPQASYSSHYAQAYMQSSAPTTSDSYALSPTWDPSAYSAGPSAIFQPSAAWFQPGSCRCTYTGCNFIASHKALETHMMDRHLIYPPGWEKRQKKPDWDADPSLKGWVHILSSRFCWTD